MSENTGIGGSCFGVGWFGSFDCEDCVIGDCVWILLLISKREPATEGVIVVTYAEVASAYGSGWKGCNSNEGRCNILNSGSIGGGEENVGGKEVISG